jgi:RimJ/RimL family protein N-acetyltransferase/predicted nucleotidyltransferase
VVSRAIQPPPHHQAILDRFIAACQADERVVAAFLGGSYARGTADAYSDLDLGLITTDEAYEGFLAEREAFIRRLGEPVFLEDFDLPHNVFFILADGAEGELALGRESQFQHIHGGPHRVLLDKKGILAGVVFPWRTAPHAEQVETLRRLITWFWHDLSHFITAMGRGQLWWAHGQLEELRLTCINLARLRKNFSAAADGYEKVEQVLPIEQLSPLQATLCPLQPSAMLQAARVIVGFYQELAPRLARSHGIAYPEVLERVMMDRLKKLGQARSEVRLRDVIEGDLPILFEQQLDPDATEMAAFPARDRDAFMAHWAKILADDTVAKKTILFDGQVAGNILSWKQGDRPLVGYWIGKEYWGKGIATRALSAFLEHVTVRPLYAHVAKHNIASIRVLEKCGFTLFGEDKGSAYPGDEVEVWVLILNA